MPRSGTRLPVAGRAAKGSRAEAYSGGAPTGADPFRSGDFEGYDALHDQAVTSSVLYDLLVAWVRRAPPTPLAPGPSVGA